MRKKSLTWMLAALMGVFATACSNDDDIAGADGNSTNTVTFRVNSDEDTQTRADVTDPEIPNGKVLRYIMEVYNQETGEIVADSRQVKTTQAAATPVEFTLEKKTGVAYNVLFWADYTTDETDLYYNTTTGGLKAVTFQNATPPTSTGKRSTETLLPTPLPEKRHRPPLS
ncbi:MAG: hypothetical protein LUE99_07035 [Bacteroides sp.]|nr:hypothetical protein [Bacteroides sp.]